MRSIASLLLTATLLFAGCTGAGASPGAGSQSPGPSAASLDGRSFLSTAIVGRDLVAGSVIRLTFSADGRIGISAGCNQMGGTYAIVDGTLTLGQLSMTEMGCEAPLMAQDTWVSGFLAGAAVALDGDTLTLTDREVADPDRPLEGTTWVVEGLTSGGAVSSVPAGVVADLTITNGQLVVHAGCNSGGAAVEVTDATLVLAPLVLTKMACGANESTVEAAVVAVLFGTVGWAIEADALALTNGQAGLMLRATSP